jgi:hypothetical protein
MRNLVARYCDFFLRVGQKLGIRNWHRPASKAAFLGFRLINRLGFLGNNRSPVRMTSRTYRQRLQCAFRGSIMETRKDRREEVEVTDELSEAENYVM